MNDILLDRYLQAVGKFLPDASRADTLAELRANLLERMDAREDELARPLTDADTAALLRELGKPESVALHYLPQRSLIGPEVFPFYLYFLKKLLPVIVILYAIGVIIDIATGPAAKSLPALAHALPAYAVGLIPNLVKFWAWSTLAFVVIDALRSRPGVRARLLAWDPMKLPAVRPPQAPAATVRSQLKRVLDLIFHCIWFAYVLWVPWHPFWLLGPGIFYFGTLGIALAPVWHTFYALLIVLLCVQLATRLLALVPSAAGAIQPLELAANAIGLVAIGYLVHASLYFVAAGASTDIHQLASVNSSIAIALRFALAFAFANFLKDLWKLGKSHTPTHHQLAF